MGSYPQCWGLRGPTDQVGGWYIFAVVNSRYGQPFENNDTTFAHTREYLPAPFYHTRKLTNFKSIG